MTDTPLEIQRMVRRHLMARSNQERFIMGVRMFDAARSMILASFPPHLTEVELKCKLSERLYGANSEVHRAVKSRLLASESVQRSPSGVEADHKTPL